MPQLIGQNDFRSTLLFSIEQLATRDACAEHLFEAHSLSTQLDPICIVLLWLPPFVFDGRDCPLVKWAIILISFNLTQLGGFSDYPDRAGQTVEFMFNAFWERRCGLWLECGGGEVDHIADTEKSKLKAMNRQTPRDANTVASFRFGPVGLFVQHTSFGCESIFDPQAFEMN